MNEENTPSTENNSSQKNSEEAQAPIEEKEQKTDTPSPENEQISSQKGEDDIHESNEARRQRLLGIENDDKIHDENEEITKGKFFANLWFKHKWKIIISLFFAVVLTICIVQIVKKDKYDLEVAYYGPVDINAELYSQMIDAFVTVYGDKELKINLVKVLYQNEKQREESSKDQSFFGTVQQEQASREALESITFQLGHGAIPFVIIDTSLHESEGFVGRFLPLEEALGVEIDSGLLSESGRGIILQKTALAKQYTAFKDLGDVVICITRGQNTKDEAYKTSIKLLKAILALEAPKIEESTQSTSSPTLTDDPELNKDQQDKVEKSPDESFEDLQKELDRLEKLDAITEEDLQALYDQYSELDPETKAELEKIIEEMKQNLENESKQ